MAQTLVKNWVVTSSTYLRCKIIAQASETQVVTSSTCKMAVSAFGNWVMAVWEYILCKVAVSVFGKWKMTVR